MKSMCIWTWSDSSNDTVSESPQPWQSTAYTWKCSASAPMLLEKLTQPVAPAPLPCMRISG